MIQTFKKKIKKFFITVFRIFWDANDVGDIGHKYIFLESKFERIKARVEDHENDIHCAMISKLFQQEKRWINAYKIEQFMIDMLNDNELNAEIKRYQLKNDANNHIVQFYISDEKIENVDKTIKREILKIVVYHSQLRHRQMQDREYYTALMERRASFALFFCFILYFLPYLSPVAADLLNVGIVGSRSYYVGSTIFAGMLGASFSILTNLERKMAECNIHSLRSMTDWPTIIARLFVGGTGGLIMFYLIDSEMLAGSMFPAIPPSNENEIITITNSQKSLLLIWCFLAGFSEKLISIVLKSKGDQVLEKDDHNSIKGR